MLATLKAPSGQPLTTSTLLKLVFVCDMLILSLSRCPALILLRVTLLTARKHQVEGKELHWPIVAAELTARNPSFVVDGTVCRNKFVRLVARTRKVGQRIGGLVLQDVSPEDCERIRLQMLALDATAGRDKVVALQSRVCACIRCVERVCVGCFGRNIRRPRLLFWWELHHQRQRWLLVRTLQFSVFPCGT